MKKTLIALSLLVSTLTHAADITYAQFQELYETHKVAYETITPGMTSEYHSIVRYENEGVEEDCIYQRKNVVLAVHPGFKYLMYTKEVTKNDCVRTGEKKGVVNEYLSWEKIFEATDWSYDKEENYKKISLNGNTVSTIYSTTDEDGTVFTRKSIREVGQSQFYSLIESKSDIITRRLIRRSETDISKIETDHLEVFDYSDY